MDGAPVIVMQLTATPALKQRAVAAHTQKGARLHIPLFAATVLTSSFLMFLLEPMTAKRLLPYFGGAPAVWNTSIVFFQAVLLAGYGYAHAVRKLGPRLHLIVHGMLVAAPLIAFGSSLGLAPAPVPGGDPFRDLFLILATSVGLPFFVLSTTASLLQSWFARSVDSGREPYWLYAASNTGSLVALLAYPTFVEPLFRLHTQAQLWTVFYAMFAALTFGCAAIVWGRRSRIAAADDRIEEAIDLTTVSWSTRGRWLALAAVPSGLMLAVTNYLSTDIAAAPLLWVVPLSLYLLTFVIAFARRRRRALSIADRALALLMVPLTVFLVLRIGGPLWLVLPVHLLVFVFASMVCHSQLADSRPSTSHLTEFYLWMAAGGTVGGMFTTLFAPMLFKQIVEYPLLLVLVCLLRPAARFTTSRRLTTRVALPLAAAVAAFAAVWAAVHVPMDSRLLTVVLGGAGIACFTQSKRPLLFTGLIAGLLLAGQLYDPEHGRSLLAERTFFGVYRVRVDRDGRFRALFHGTTLHGIQRVDDRRGEPLGYYTRSGPFGQMMDAMPRLSSTPAVAVVGLGVGSLAAYASGDQRWTFYEIDPAVERIARSAGFFTYLRECGSRCRVVVGDARLSLAAAPAASYGLIVVDAFSSDAIPVHLITSEALDVYLDRLAPGGVLAFHVSNRHFSLGPVLGRLALAHGLVALEQLHQASPEGLAEGQNHSDWVVMSRPGDVAPLTRDARWTAPDVTPATPAWTDDFSNIVGILKW
jgi:SAM-dependent methyltransferase